MQPISVLQLPPDLVHQAQSLQAHIATELPNLDHRQSLGQKVSHHKCNGHIYWCHHALLNHISQLVKAQLDMFESPMVLWILSHCNSRVIIHVERGGRIG